MPATGTCMICQGRCKENHWVCRGCAKEHGLDKPFRDWPDWAKRMVADTIVERRQEQNQMYTDPLTRRYERKRAEILGEPYEEAEEFVEIPFSDIQGEREDISELWT